MNSIQYSFLAVEKDARMSTEPTFLLSAATEARTSAEQRNDSFLINFVVGWNGGSLASTSHA